MTQTGRLVADRVYPDRAPTHFRTKTRYLWQPSALRLMREKACVQYARRVVPRTVDGFAILFPLTEISFGLRVTVRSQDIDGRDLFSLLYEEAMHGLALEVGMAALKALSTADVPSAHFRLASLVYRLARGPRVLLREMLGSTVLSRAQKQELNRLVMDHVRYWGGKQVLVHGDLHASHVIVEPGRRSVGLIDLEAMHIGKAATNFAQLWGGFHYADRLLGQQFYQRYQECFPDLLDARFDTDVRLEVALRSYSHIKVGRRQGNSELEGKGARLLANVLSGARFDQVCQGGGP